MAYRIWKEPELKDQVKQSCSRFKGDFVTYSDGTYSCKGVLDSVIDYDLGKVNLKQTGASSRLKEVSGDGHANYVMEEDLF